MQQERKFERINRYFFAGYALLCVIAGIYYGSCRDGYHFFSALGSLALPLAYVFVMRLLHLQRSAQLDFIILAFVLLSYPLGVVLEFFSRIPYYDKLCHTLAGVLSAMLVFGLFLFFDPNHKLTRDNRISAMLFVFMGSMAVAGLWELCEYGVWTFTGRDVQKVQTTGINDTMQDMLVHLLGTIAYLPSVWHCERKQNDLLVAAPMEFIARNPAAFAIKTKPMKEAANTITEKTEDTDMKAKQLVCFDNVLQEVIQVIERILSQLEHPTVSAQTSLRNELYFDSMSIVFLLLEMEMHFDIEADWNFASDTPMEIAESVWYALCAADMADRSSKTCEPQAQKYYFCEQTA